MNPVIQFFDGNNWELSAKDSSGRKVLALLSHAMDISAESEEQKNKLKKNLSNLSILTSTQEKHWCDLPVEKSGRISCPIGSIDTPEFLAFQLIRVSQLIANNSENKGGLLVHGALAEWKGHGVILAGAGGAGKTTASNRLLKPWISHCDDITLIVKNPQGQFWAHPWPTWSRYLQGDFFSSWNVQHAVKLDSIFFLQKSSVDRISPVAKYQAISQMVDFSHQATWSMAMGMNQKTLRKLRLQRFNNIIEIAKNVPIFILDVSLTGTFWTEIEKHIQKIS